MARTLLSCCLGLLGLCVALELALRLLPVPSASLSGYYHDPDVLTYPAHHRWQAATGWDLRNAQVLASNDWGFVADHDFTPDARAVALIGDSYTEASMLDATDRPAAQLEAMLGQRKVYAMGSPGTALLDYAQRIRLASERLQVRDFVLLLERYDARQALCGSGNVVSRCLDPDTLAPRTERQPPPDLFKRLLRHSALAQYLVGQLRVRPQALLQAMLTRSAPEEPAAAAPLQARAPAPAQVARAEAVVDAVVAQFFATARPYLHGRLVVLVDGRRSGPPAQPELIDLERRRLIERLRAGGAIVHDLEPVYAAHAAVSRRSLDVGPYDGHLNALGVRLAMARAASSLQP